MLFSPESIFQGTPTEVHGWMDYSQDYFSLIPTPYLYVVFLLFMASALTAQERNWSLFFGGLSLAVFGLSWQIGIPFVLNLPFYGFCLILGALVWTVKLFRGEHNQASRALALLGAFVAGLFCTMGFPFLGTLQPQACRSNLKNIAVAAKMYHTDHESYPDDIRLLTPNYLVRVPECPGHSGPSYSIKSLEAPRNFVVHCDNPAHVRPAWRDCFYYGDLGVSEER